MISRRLRVLEETGVLRRTIDNRIHRSSIQPGVPSESVSWMDRQGVVVGALFVVDEYLEEDWPR